MGAILRTRVAGGNPPDVALDPRPGEVAEFARAGNLVDLSKFVSASDLSAAFNQAYIDLGKVDGKQVGILWKANSKSTFWYKPASLKALGAQTPKTLDELFTLADKYKAAGKTPFAIGGKDGWVLTDYFENIMARVGTPQQYNDLHVTHKLAWTDPTVKKALTQLARFFKPDYVPGGTQGILGTQFVDSIGQVFGPQPKAELFFEGGFVGVIAATTYTNLKPGEDFDFFTFPQVDAQFGDPIVGGGDTLMMFKDSPEAEQFIKYLISKEAADVFATTNTISPNKLLDPSKFPSVLARNEYQQLANAKTFLFDGSDLAPSSLGGDFEFTKLQDLVGKPTEVDRIAQELEPSQRDGRIDAAVHLFRVHARGQQPARPAGADFVLRDFTAACTAPAPAAKRESSARSASAFSSQSASSISTTSGEPFSTKSNPKARAYPFPRFAGSFRSTQLAPAARATAVSRLGWHDKLFVLPDAVFGAPPNGERVILQTSQPTEHTLRQQGTLEGWKFDAPKGSQTIRAAASGGRANADFRVRDSVLGGPRNIRHGEN